MRHVTVFFICDASGCRVQTEQLVPAHRTSVGRVILDETVPEGWRRVGHLVYCPSHEEPR